MHTKIKFEFRTLILAFACVALSQAATVAAAQDPSPALADESPRQTQTTKSGEVDGLRSPSSWSPALTGERHPLYRLHKSDVVEIKFAFEPEFDQVVSVQPDGFITLKGLDELFAEGLKLPELRDAVRNAYVAVLRDPEINIFLKDFERPYFIAGGEVGRPGKYDLRADITLTEAVALAGGFNERSKHSQVVVFRRVTSDIVESHLVNLKSLLRSRNLTEDLQPDAGRLHLRAAEHDIQDKKIFANFGHESLFDAHKILVSSEPARRTHYGRRNGFIAGTF